MCHPDITPGSKEVITDGITFSNQWGKESLVTFLRRAELWLKTHLI